MSEGRKIFYDKPARGRISVPSRAGYNKSKQLTTRQSVKKHVKKTFDGAVSKSLLSERSDAQTLTQLPEFAHISQEIALLNNMAETVSTEPVVSVFAPPPEKILPNPIIKTPEKKTKFPILAVKHTKKKTPAGSTVKKKEKINLVDTASEKPFKIPSFISSESPVSHARGIDEAKFSRREIQRERRRIEKEEKRRAREISTAELAAEKHIRPNRFRVLRWSVSLVLVAAVGFVMYDTARTNFDMQAYMSRPREAGIYDTVNMVSEEPISKSDIKYHSVGKADPRYLTIESAGVSSRVLSAGTDEYGRILLPQNIFDVNWYSESVRPGAVGAMVMSGYMSGPTQPGAFAKSSKIKTGGYITVERGDGIKINYLIEKIETMRVEDVNIEEVFQVYGGAGHGLNLIINTGNWAQGNLDNSDRTIVYAVVSQNQ